MKQKLESNLIKSTSSEVNHTLLINLMQTQFNQDYTLINYPNLLVELRF